MESSDVRKLFVVEMLTFLLNCRYPNGLMDDMHAGFASYFRERILRRSVIMILEVAKVGP